MILSPWLCVCSTEASWTEETERESDGREREREKEILRIKMKSLTEHSSPFHRRMDFHYQNDITLEKEKENQ